MLSVIVGTLVVFTVLTGGGYVWWSAADPAMTCNRCHEINPSYSSWAMSAHREVACHNCHGTALSNGWHSVKEKARMVFVHYGREVTSEDIALNELQIQEAVERCRNCHNTEYTLWNSGGHSATYADIFLDEAHNTTEQLNFDCLRCHGMFFEGTIQEVAAPLDTIGPWRLVEEDLAGRAVMPCMACHKIHSEGMPTQQPDHSKPEDIFYSRMKVNETIGLYSRHEKMHFQLEHLPTPVMLNHGDTVKNPDDPVYRLCVQCHAPSVWHRAGEGDDRTPTGVHEGISCAACHEPHSNYQGNSCDTCHPAISNCNLDVRTMNTSFASAVSKHNIHSVACTDCHDERPL
jgi:hypothetical protein